MEKNSLGGVFLIFAINNMENNEDRGKLEAIYKLYIKDILYVSYDILKDHFEAEDVAQSTIIKLAENIQKIEVANSRKTRAFAVIIAKNLSRNIYNNRKHKKTIPIDEIIEPCFKSQDETPEAYVLRLDNSEWIARKLSKIKDEYAEILTLRYTYDYSIKEIAPLLDITEGNVRIRLLRAKEALRKVMEVDCDETIRNKSN
jgi:RNA polymerase sigma-70 factor (ECF subfamily)